MNCFRALKRIKNQSGETISEVLVAALIATIALLMLATMLATSFKMITSGRNRMEAYYDETDQLSQGTTVPGSAKATLSVKLVQGEDTFSVNYSQTSFNGIDIISYTYNGTTP